MTDPTEPEATGKTAPDAADPRPGSTDRTAPDAADPQSEPAEKPASDVADPKPDRACGSKFTFTSQGTTFTVVAVCLLVGTAAVVVALSKVPDSKQPPSKSASVWAADPLPPWVWPLTAGVLALVVAFGFWVHWVAWQERRDAANRDRDALESAAHRLREKMELSSLVEFNRVRLDQYHGIATNQASKAFRSSRIAMNIGLLILVVAFAAGWRLNAQGDRLFVGTVAAVGTAFAGYLSRTYMATYERTLQQLNQYFNQPVMNGYFLTAERIAASLTGDRKEDVLERVVDGVLESGKVLHYNATGASKQDQAKPRKRWWHRRAAQGEATAPTE